jgi:hypothetical protein
VSSRITSSPPEDVKFSLKALPEGGLTDREQRLLVHAQPLLQAMALFDFLKRTYDLEKLGLRDTSLSSAQYVSKLAEVLATGNLENQLAVCASTFEEFKSKICKFTTLEDYFGYLQVEEAFGAQEPDTYAWLKRLLN